MARTSSTMGAAGAIREQLYDVRPGARAATFETQALLRGDETRPSLPQSVRRRSFLLGQRELQHEAGSASLDDVAFESRGPATQCNPEEIAPHHTR